MNDIGIFKNEKISSPTDWRKISATTALAISLSAELTLATTSNIIRNGLTDVLTASRPKHLPGEQENYVCRSSARSLLKHATGWAGNDLEERLSEVYETRGEVEF